MPFVGPDIRQRRFEHHDARTAGIALVDVLRPGWRERPIDETFPWEHISTSVRKKFLTEDYLWSLQGKTRVDCRERCFACGILPTFADLRRLNPGDVWQCPEVKSKQIPLQMLPDARPYHIREN